jgi:hypothetical protein
MPRTLADDLAAREQTFRIRKELNPVKTTPLQAWRQACDDVAFNRPVKPALARLRLARTDARFPSFSYAGLEMSEFELRIVSNSLKMALVGPVYRCPLRELDLRNCGIDYSRAWWLAKGLAGNATLESLNLRGNPLCSEGVEVLLKGLTASFALLQDYPPEEEEELGQGQAVPEDKAGTDAAIALVGAIAFDKFGRPVYAPTGFTPGTRSGLKAMHRRQSLIDRSILADAKVPMTVGYELPRGAIPEPVYSNAAANPPLLAVLDESTEEAAVEVGAARATARAARDALTRTASISPYLTIRAQKLVELGVPPSTPFTPHGSLPPVTAAPRAGPGGIGGLSEGLEEPPPGELVKGPYAFELDGERSDWKEEYEGGEEEGWDGADVPPTNPEVQAQQAEAGAEAANGGGTGFVRLPPEDLQVQIARPGTGSSGGLTRGHLLQATAATGLSRAELLGHGANRVLRGLALPLDAEPSVESEPSLTADGAIVPFLDLMAGPGRFRRDGRPPEALDSPEEVSISRYDLIVGTGSRPGTASGPPGQQAPQGRPDSSSGRPQSGRIPPRLASLSQLSGAVDQLPVRGVGTTAVDVRGAAIIGLHLAGPDDVARTRRGLPALPRADIWDGDDIDEGVLPSMDTPAAPEIATPRLEVLTPRVESRPLTPSLVTRPGTATIAQSARSVRFPAVEVSGVERAGAPSAPRPVSPLAKDVTRASSLRGGEESATRPSSTASSRRPRPDSGTPHPAVVAVGVDLPDPAKGGRAREVKEQEAERAVAAQMRELTERMGVSDDVRIGAHISGSAVKTALNSSATAREVASATAPLKVSILGQVIEQKKMFTPVVGPRGIAGPVSAEDGRVGAQSFLSAATTPGPLADPPASSHPVLHSRLRYLNLSNTHIGLSAAAAAAAFRLSDVSKFDGRGVSAVGSYLAHPSCGLTNLNISKNVLPSGVTEQLLACLDANSTLQVLGAHDLPGSGPPLAAALTAKAAGLSLGHGRAALSDDRLGLGRYTGRVTGAESALRMASLMAGGSMGTGGSWNMKKKQLAAARAYGGDGTAESARRFKAMTTGVPDGPDAAYARALREKVTGFGKGGVQAEGSLSSLQGAVSVYSETGAVADGSVGSGEEHPLDIPPLYVPPVNPITSPEELVRAAQDVLGPFLRDIAGVQRVFDPTVFTERVAGMEKLNLSRCSLGDVGALAVAVVLMAAARADNAERSAYFISIGRRGDGRRLRGGVPPLPPPVTGVPAHERYTPFSAAADVSVAALFAEAEAQPAEGEGEDGGISMGGSTVLGAALGDADGALARANAPVARPGLRFIKLRHNGFGPLSLRTLVRALRCSRTLLKIDISSNPLGTAGCRLLTELIQDPSTVLEELYVDSCELTANGEEMEPVLAMLHALRYNRSLAVLSLRHNTLVPQPLRHLPPVRANVVTYSLPLILATNVSLRLLDLRDNRILDAGAVAAEDAVRSSPSCVPFARDVADVLTKWVADGLRKFHPPRRWEQAAAPVLVDEQAPAVASPAGASYGSREAAAQLISSALDAGTATALSDAKKVAFEAYQARVQGTGALPVTEAAPDAESSKAESFPRVASAPDVGTALRVQSVSALLAASKSGSGAVAAALALLAATEPAWVTEAKGREIGPRKPPAPLRAVARPRAQIAPAFATATTEEDSLLRRLKHIGKGRKIRLETLQVPAAGTAYGYPRVVLAAVATHDVSPDDLPRTFGGVTYTAADGGPLPLSLVVTLAGSGPDLLFTSTPVAVNHVIIRCNPYVNGAFTGGEIALPRLDFTRLPGGTYGGMSEGNVFFGPQGGVDDVLERREALEAMGASNIWSGTMRDDGSSEPGGSIKMRAPFTDSSVVRTEDGETALVDGERALPTSGLGGLHRFPSAEASIGSGFPNVPLTVPLTRSGSSGDLEEGPALWAQPPPPAPRGEMRRQRSFAEVAAATGAAILGGSVQMLMGVDEEGEGYGLEEGEWGVHETAAEYNEEEDYALAEGEARARTVTVATCAGGSLTPGRERTWTLDEDAPEAAAFLQSEGGAGGQRVEGGGNVTAEELMDALLAATAADDDETAPESDAAERAAMEEERRPPTPTDTIVDALLKRAADARAAQGGGEGVEEAPGPGADLHQASMASLDADGEGDTSTLHEETLGSMSTLSVIPRDEGGGSGMVALPPSARPPWKETGRQLRSRRRLAPKVTVDGRTISAPVEFAGDGGRPPGTYTLTSMDRTASKQRVPVGSIPVRVQANSAGVSAVVLFPVFTVVQLRADLITRVFSYLGEPRTVLT